MKHFGRGRPRIRAMLTDQSACGWCKDRWGFSWQITPKRLMDLMSSSDRAKAKRVMEAMMTMSKIDIATLEAAAATNHEGRP